jgi:hypothetical protein
MRVRRPGHHPLRRPAANNANARRQRAARGEDALHSITGWPGNARPIRASRRPRCHRHDQTSSRSLRTASLAARSNRVSSNTRRPCPITQNRCEILSAVATFWLISGIEPPRTVISTSGPAQDTRWSRRGQSARRTRPFPSLVWPFTDPGTGSTLRRRSRAQSRFPQTRRNTARRRRSLR